MNRSRFLILGGMSVVVGLMASLYIYRYVRGLTAPEPMIEVMVAASDLQVGARVEKTDIKIVRVPVSVLPPGSPRKAADVIGRGVVLPIAKGQFLLSMQLAGENAGSGLPSLIPLGMRAVGVRVNDVTSVAGFVTPGTRVDVLMTGTPKGKHRTITVLQNVGVLAAGPKLERKASGESQTASVVTLLVNLDDAERLILANNEGNIQLVLRNPGDARSETIRDAGPEQLYKEPSANPVKLRRTTVQRPLNVPAVPSDLPEIQIYTGPEQKTVKCLDGGVCKEVK